MNESEPNGDAANQEPPAKRKHIASFSDAGSSLVKKVGVLGTDLTCYSFTNLYFQ